MIETQEKFYGGYLRRNMSDLGISIKYWLPDKCVCLFGTEGSGFGKFGQDAQIFILYMWNVYYKY